MPAIRVSDGVLAKVKAKAKEMGCSIGKAIEAAFDAQGESADCVQKVGRGAASMLVASAEHQLTFNRVKFIIAQGYLWQVGRTRNWSGYELLKVSAIPQGFNSTILRTMQDFGLYTLGGLLDYCQTMLSVESQEWYQALEPRRQEEVHRAHIMDGWSEAKLMEEFGVITVPQEPVPTKLKATQLQQRYGINADEWHQSVEVWKKKGLETIDGLVWSFRRSQTVWVAV